MLALDKQLAKKIGEHYILALEGKGKPIYAITSNYLSASRVYSLTDQISC